MQKNPIFRTGIGQDSHRFLLKKSAKRCVVGGIVFEECPGLDADSDGDVVYHALCNAISSLSGVPILGGIARTLCRDQNITNSKIYVYHALKTLGEERIVHAAFTIEGNQPRFQPRIDEMRTSVGRILNITHAQVGITVTSGDGLTDFGRGLGLQCFCILTTCS